MGFMKPKIPSTPVAPAEPETQIEESIDPLQEERLKKQRASGRYSTFLSQEAQLGDGIKL